MFPDFWYNASAGSDVSEPPKIEEGRLHACGFVVDSIQRSRKQTWEADAPSMPSQVGKVGVQYDNLLRELKDTMKDALSESSGLAYEQSQKPTAFSLTLCAGLSRYRCAEDNLLQHFKDFAWIPKTLRLDHLLPGTSSEMDGQGESERFLADMRMVCEGRTFIFTEKGRYGLAPMIAQAGDICCVLLGATVPFIVRRTDTEDHFKFIGEAYVHGIMRGEALRADNTKPQTFILC